MPGFDADSPCGAFLDELRIAAESNPRLRWGELAPPVKVPAEVFACLFREALSPAGAVEGWFVWRDLGSEVAVHREGTRVALLPGFVICGLRMRCDQVLDTTELTVPLGTGTEDEPAGLLMTGEIAARGDDLLIDAWGDVSVVACWTAVVNVAIRVAAAAGVDSSCEPLLPGAVWTAEDMFTVIPQARHAIDALKAPG
jgi:hypothetical protein